MVQPMVQRVALLKIESMMINHDNICVVNGSSLVKNLDGVVLVEYDFLADVFFLEDVTLVVNRVQQLDLTRSSLTTIPNLLTSKETRFVDELKITTKWDNMFDERKDSNTEKNDDPIQTTKKLDTVDQRKLILNPIK